MCFILVNPFQTTTESRRVTWCATTVEACDAQKSEWRYANNNLQHAYFVTKQKIISLCD